MDDYCSDCKTATDVVFDHSSGDTICSECGLVLESRSIDDTSEWRTFTDDSRDDDPVRVGAPTNPLLAEAGLSTMISKPNGVTSSSSLSRFQNNGSNPERRIRLAFEAISTMADRLGLLQTIKDRAKELFTKVSKSSRGRSQDATLAACLHVACRQEDNPRTLKEILSVANGATKREVNREIHHMRKHLKVEMGTIHAEDFTRRFCSNLRMNNQALVKAVQEALEKSKECDIRRSPISIAAAVVYLVAQMNSGDGHKKASFRDVSIATGVAEGTIRDVYRDLHPHISKIIPMQMAVR